MVDTDWYWIWRKLNQIAEYKKLKTETISTILYLIRPGVYMDKLDINDVYYCIPILEEHQKLLKFKYSATLYKFIALSNRYTEELRKFTKTLNTAWP